MTPARIGLGPCRLRSLVVEQDRRSLPGRDLEADQRGEHGDGDQDPGDERHAEHVARDDGRQQPGRRAGQHGGDEPDHRRDRQELLPALVREALAEWGLDFFIDHTVLISSELVTNALRHGAGTITIRLYRARRHLRIEVHDHGTGRPVRRRAATGDESGRGLAVIDGLIAMYHGKRGCIDDDTGPGKTVYVVLQITANASGAR